MVYDYIGIKLNNCEMMHVPNIGLSNELVECITAEEKLAVFDV